MRRHRLTWEQGQLKAGLNKPVRTDNKGLSLEDGIDAFIEDIGSLPRNCYQLYRWAISRRVSLTFPRKTPGVATRHAIDQVIADRERAELPALDLRGGSVRRR